MPRYSIPFVIFSALLAGGADAAAQELSGSLTVEGTYQPVVRTHNRLSGTPTRLMPQMPQSQLSVSLDGVTTPVTPTFALTPPADEAIRLPEAYDGYASLRMGSWLNTSLSAGYRFVNTGRTKLGAWLQHNSTWLYRPDAPHANYPEAARRKLADQTIGIYADHSLGSAGTLSADMAYRLAWFNYATNYNYVGATSSIPAPTQTLNDLRIGAKWTAKSSPSLIADASLAYRYFGYRRLYAWPEAAVAPMREGDFMPCATIGYRLSRDMAVAMHADAHLLFYSGRANAPEATLPGAYPMPLGCTDDYGIVGLTPAWTYTAGAWSLRAGVRADLSWGTASSFSAVHIAPDVALAYSAGPFTGSLSATGGVKPNTLASRAEEDYYQCPTLIDNLPQYTPLDLLLHFEFGDFRGFSAGLSAGYAISDNTPVSGWYPYTLFGINPLPEPGLLTAPYKPLSTLSLKGFTVGANLGYAWGNMLDVKGSLSYQRQRGKTGYYNGADRPRWLIDLSATVKPIEGLSVGAGYEYRGVRSLWLAEREGAPAVGGEHNFVGEPDILRLRLNDVTALRVFASYTLNRRYTFSLEARNILGSEEGLNPLLPTDGFNLLGGVSVLF